MNNRQGRNLYCADEAEEIEDPDPQTGHGGLEGVLRGLQVLTSWCVIASEAACLAGGMIRVW